MDLPAPAPFALPGAAELAVAALLWVCAAWLGLCPPPAGGDPFADRVRLAARATAIGLGLWAALLCVLTALTGATAAQVGPSPFVGALVLAVAVASLSGLAAAGAAAWLSPVAALAGACGLGAVALLLAAALGIGRPPLPTLGAIAIALLTGQTTLAWAQRKVQGGAPTAPPQQRAAWALGVTFAAALPVALLVGVLPAVVSSHGSTGAPWLFALFAALAMAMAAAGGFVDRRSGSLQRRLHERLRVAAAHADGAPLTDTLTGLPNRAGLAAWLGPAVNDALQRDGQVALVVIGLDGFKKVNDAFGHRGGDAALLAVARRLEAACAALSAAPGFTAGPLARTGGDEFTLVLQGRPQRDDAARVAARVLELLAPRLVIEGGEVGVTASIGVACAPHDGVATTLLPHAEAALRAAKEGGGAGYALFEARLVDEARDRLDLLRDLRSAVEAKQLELFYQPKIDAKSGQVTAAEALLRWHHPTRGMMSPVVFIPLAERYGLINTLGNWVIDDACRQARKWRKAGLKMRVAINLSAYQMRQDDLIERIHEALATHGIDPSRLTCEITETVAMEDTQVTQRTFERLGEAGIHLSIDDFGTGYSSLAYLRRLPAQELKIDRAFVKDLGTSADAHAIVDAVIKMAHAIGLKVVAEGVENMQQRDALLQLGCDEMQGFLFAKPMSARALLLWAVDDRPAQHAFRPSLFADTNTPTQIGTTVRA